MSSLVNGYWLIKDATTGHSALVGKLASTSPGQTPLLSSTVYAQIGAGIGDQITSYYLGGDANNLGSEVERALGQMQISTDTIPTDFSSLLKNGIQGINFDILVPVGADPNTYQQGTASLGNQASQAVQTSAQAVQTSAQAITGLAGVIQTIWNAVKNPSNWLRGLEFVGGAVLLYMGLKSLTGASGPSVASVAKAAAA